MQQENEHICYRNSQDMYRKEKKIVKVAAATRLHGVSGNKFTATSM
jgi:hypothetical protein